MEIQVDVGPSMAHRKEKVSAWVALTKLLDTPMPPLLYLASHPSPLFPKLWRCMCMRVHWCLLTILHHLCHIVRHPDSYPDVSGCVASHILNVSASRIRVYYDSFGFNHLTSLFLIRTPSCLGTPPNNGSNLRSIFSPMNTAIWPTSATVPSAPHPLTPTPPGYHGLLKVVIVNDEMPLVSWNVRGLVDPLRTTILRQLLRHQAPSPMVVCLQELQGQRNIVDFQLAKYCLKG